MSHLHPKKPASATVLRHFGLLVGGAFGALAIPLFGRDVGVIASVFAMISGLLLFFGVIAPRRLRLMYDAWMAFALALSKVTTPIFMGIIYFLVLTPTAVLARAFRHRAKPGTSSWVVRAPGMRQSALERQF